ncbi:unnamed protein product [Durusdinium trenchii]|uniref:Uncharacterized protein n=3 Tax=Durusdinium trenchii TaxID=1381693 RepID=A0ABP0NGI4_9DINO
MEQQWEQNPKLSKQEGKDSGRAKQATTVKKTIDKEHEKEGADKFSAYEVGQIMEDNTFNNLLITFCIYREARRRCRGQKETSEGGAQTLFKRKVENNQRLNNKQKRGIMKVFEHKFRQLNRNNSFRHKDDKIMSFTRIMRRGHFLNVHHYHDHHNQVLYRLRPEVTKADFYTVAVLAYWTGDRFFVEKIVECVNKEVENKHYQENALAEQPVLFFESWVKEHLKSFSWKEDTIPAFFHRRFRPCIQKDSTYRKILAESLMKDNGKCAKRNLKAFTIEAMRQILDKNRFLKQEVIQDVVAAQSYDSIFSVLEHVATGSEPGFHAKNLANTLEHRFFDYSWKQSPESDLNGLGPGFRQMAHMKKGYDKKAKILKEPELTEDLKESTKLLQDAWPWKSRIRLRHVQSAYCELQKFLSLARNGFPPTTSVRSSCLPELSYETSRKLADKYEKKNGEKDEEEEEEEEDKDNGSSRRRLRQE